MRIVLLILLVGSGFFTGYLVGVGKNDPVRIEVRRTALRPIAPRALTTETPIEPSAEPAAPSENDPGATRRIALERKRIEGAVHAYNTVQERMLDEYSDLFQAIGIREEDRAPLLERLKDIILVKYQYAYAMADFEARRQSLELASKGLGEEQFSKFSWHQRSDIPREQYADFSKFAASRGIAISESEERTIIEAIMETESLDATRIHSIGGPLSDPPHNDAGPPEIMLPRLDELQQQLIQTSKSLIDRLVKTNMRGEIIELNRAYVRDKLEEYSFLRSVTEAQRDGRNIPRRGGTN